MKRVVLAAAALLAHASFAAEPAAPTFLHEVSVETMGTFPEHGFGRARVELFLSSSAAGKPDALTARKAAKLADGVMSLELGGYPGGIDKALPKHTAPSFVVDYDAASFAPLRAALPSTPEALRDFAHRYIDKKNLSRSYDVASVVAARKEGDCTEHAVFLAALLRLKKIPARVAHGLVLVRSGGQTRAFGHAWVEVRGPRAWTPLDAALDVDPRAPVYLPLSVMEDEGLAHSLDGMSRISLADVLRVRVTSP